MTTATERLYYADSRLLEFTARVVERADEGRRVYLDRTAFYPTSGGQPHDLGALGGIRVHDVVDEGDRIAHLLATPLEADGEVHGVVDAARRLDHMQQHTGQHLVSAVLHDLYGWATVSVHFGAETNTVDVGAPPTEVTAERLAAAERRGNALVAEDRIVSVSFEHAGAVEGLRKAAAREGVLRVVTIEGVDRSACGGTHVRALGEVGAVLLRKSEKVKQGTRVEFLCGLRAVARARRDFESLSQTAQALAVGLDEVPSAVAALAEQARESDRRRRAVEAEAAAGKARALYDAVPPDASGVRRALERRTVQPGDVKDAGEAMRAFALAYAMLPRAVLVGVVAAEGAATASVLVAASEDSGTDAGLALREALAPIGARGGGSPRLAQGAVPADERLTAVLVRLGVMTE